MRISVLAGLVALVGCTAAAPSTIKARAGYVLHEKRDAEPKKWVKRDRLHSHRVVPVRIGMTQSNLEHGERYLLEVSDPYSPRFGQHYSEEEVNDLFAPSPESVNAINEWLSSEGIDSSRVSTSYNKQWIQFDALAHELENLLDTNYHEYEHTTTGYKHIGCDEYHVPSHIQKHVDYVTPGLRLLAPRRASGELESRSDINRRALKLPGPIKGPKHGVPNNTAPGNLIQMCDQIVTPPCVATAYNITPAPNTAAPGNAMGIFEEGDFYAAEDLALYLATFTNIPATTMPQLKGIDGGMAPGLVATGESNLDLSLAYPIIYPQKIHLFQTDDFIYSNINQTQGIFNTFLDAIDGSYCNYTAYGITGNSAIDPKYPNPNPAGYQGQLQCGKYKATNVISISYGEQEDDIPLNYQKRQCNEYMKLGMRGSTVIYASGDSGVAARAADDGNADGCLGKGQVFSPDFPAACPWVTALGSTYLPPGSNVSKDEEVSTTRFPSGGGFSNIYPQPKYQANAVNAFLATPEGQMYPSYSVSNTNNPTAAQYGSGIFNRAGRGYPDFSALGDNIIIFLDGTPQLIGGTSASAPIFGSIINRINEARIASGKGPVGFVNPTLYANPKVLHDITVGNNSGCGTSGFHARAGWDPVSGYGTPNYPKMLKLFMGLP